MKLQKDSIIECTIESLAFGGRGLARVNGMAVFVDYSVPGQTVRAKIMKAKKRFAEAVAVEVLKRSPLEVAPRCAHFGDCGGCAHQDMIYDAQVEEKAKQLRDTLERIGGVEQAEHLPPVPSPRQWGYRNKMEFAFAGKGRGLALGLRSRRSSFVVNLSECHLLPEGGFEIVQAVREACGSVPVPAWDERDGRGYWRHLVLRHSATDNTFMVHLITAPIAKYHEDVRGIGGWLRDEFPQVTSFVHSVRKSRKALAFGEKRVFVDGDEFITEQLGDVRYRISPEAFFQTNTGGAEALYGVVKDFCGLTGTETVYDLYCGSGGIALQLAGDAGMVVGVDSVPEAVEDARFNAEENGLGNCDFDDADLTRPIEIPADAERPDVIVADPPRDGMSPAVVSAILELSPKKVVAVSCNPGTLARDVAALSPAYRLEKVRCVDLFPHTPHSEAVCLLTRVE